MDTYTSDKEGIHCLIDILVSKGVKRVVLSPGSRNAPLTVSFARDSRIRHYVVLDERSAAFMALGMAQESGEPVAMACTSGTAVLNYGPALAEAYYKQIPLIAVTADRPSEWIDQADGQTIRQRNVFANYVKASYQIPAELQHPEDRWFVDREVNDALNCALKGAKGPVHINVPLREPLYGTLPSVTSNVRSIRFMDSVSRLSESSLSVLSESFSRSRRTMVLAGFSAPDVRLQRALHRLAGLPQVVVLTETPSNIVSDRSVPTIDRVLAVLGPQEKRKFAPELLISLGGSLISRHIKHFLRENPPSEHWHLSREEHPADTFQCLTTHISTDPAVLLEQLYERAAASAPDVTAEETSYADAWKTRRRLAETRHRAFETQVDWCDWKAYAMILPSVPSDVSLHLSNSTVVRYAQLFTSGHFRRVDCNRGTSGIDGCTSTAVGASVVNETGRTLLLTGDMGFLYDSNALWNRYVTPRLKIVVFLNGGGGIFRFIPGPSTLEELEECFETVTDVDVRGFAHLHRFAYFEAADEASLGAVLTDFWKEEERPAILAVRTPRKKNADRLRTYFRVLAGEEDNEL